MQIWCAGRALLLLIALHRVRGLRPNNAEAALAHAPPIPDGEKIFEVLNSGHLMKEKPNVTSSKPPGSVLEHGYGPVEKAIGVSSAIHQSNTAAEDAKVTNVQIPVVGTAADRKLSTYEGADAKQKSQIVAAEQSLPTEQATEAKLKSLTEQGKVVEQQLEQATDATLKSLTEHGTTGRTQVRSEQGMDARHNILMQQAKADEQLDAELKSTSHEETAVEQKLPTAGGRNAKHELLTEHEKPAMQKSLTDLGKTAKQTSVGETAEGVVDSGPIPALGKEKAVGQETAKENLQPTQEINAMPETQQPDTNTEVVQPVPSQASAVLPVSRQAGEPRAKKKQESEKDVRQRLEHHLEVQDVEAWSRDWKKMEVLLKEAMKEQQGPSIEAKPSKEAKPYVFDVNKAPDAADGKTLLGRAAKAGWLPGVMALVQWDKGRSDSAPRLSIETGGVDLKMGTPLSPLTLAGENSHADVVRYLLEQRASPMVPDQHGKTPLEFAAGAGDVDVMDALLVHGSPLAYGMAALRMELNTEAVKLPHLSRRWPFGASEDTTFFDMQKKVAAFGIHITPLEKLEIGDRPADWIEFYKNRVMRAHSTASKVESENVAQAEKLLSYHMYDSFARGFSLTIVVLCVMLGIFGMFVYVIFRIRLFGGLEVPVCLSHMVPGTFDPIRLADDDFDPSRQTVSFPYKTSAASLADALPSLSVAGVAYLKAILGVFSSWLFLSVRIPPVKEPFDEDFLSDDDDNSRAKVCDQCADRARFAHKFEILVRTVVLGTLLWWLCWKAERWGEASILIFIYLIFSLLAASAATGASLAVAEDASSSSIKVNAGDSARLVYALFGVQHGPRWMRAVCTTRSTAAPNKARMARRQRSKRGSAKKKQPDEMSDGGEEKSESEQQEKLELKAALSGGEVSFFDSWKRSFTQSGKMHIEHRAYLGMSVCSITIISLTLLWLTHLRTLALGSFGNFYASVAPMELFKAYGAPNSGVRGAAVLLELALLFFTGERLYSITCILHSAALSLQQRYHALIFANDHSPPPLVQKGESQETASIFADADRRVDEYVRCGKFSMELSSLRWEILRMPVFLAFTIDLMLLALATFSMTLKCIEHFSDQAYPRLQSFLTQIFHLWVIDPMVPLGIGICLTWPLLAVLSAAALSNGMVTELRQRLLRDAACLTELSSGIENTDVQYVALKLKAQEALPDSMICWPGGREVSFCEVSFLLILTVLACSLAIATGSVLPGVVGRSEQTLL